MVIKIDIEKNRITKNGEDVRNSWRIEISLTDMSTADKVIKFTNGDCNKDDGKKAEILEWARDVEKSFSGFEKLLFEKMKSESLVDGDFKEDAIYREDTRTNS